MWSVIWRVAAAAVGLVFLRRALYQRHWGHGRWVAGAVNAGLGLALCSALWRDVPATRPWLLGVAAAGLLPWRSVVAAFLDRRLRAGLDALAAEWGTEVEEGPGEGILTVRRPADDDRREAWVGNVLTRMRSLHPGVSTSAVQRMMAFVVRLEREPLLLCSLSKGWRMPVYHENEWREHTVMQGERFRLSMGSALAEEGRETGGSTDVIDSQAGVPAEERFDAFTSLWVNDGRRFFDLFEGELLEEFFACAFQGPQFECNVTPTSVNIYTIYLGPEQQKRNVAFLDRLADAVVGRAETREAGRS